MTTARLMLAGGSGRLVRRPSVVLFDPSGQNQDLANRFDAAASDSEAVDELKKYLIESGFTAAPLVIAQWSRAEFNLLVFGDVQVHTSAIAAPMVSGAGSATWVERHLGAVELGPATKVEVWSGEAADPTTNLGLGVVACAGFRMSLDLAELQGGLDAASPAGQASLSDVAAPLDGDGMTIRTEPAPASGSVADATMAATAAARVVASVPAPLAQADSAPVDAAASAVTPDVAANEPVAVPTPGEAVSEWIDTEDSQLTDTQVEAPADQPVAEAAADPFVTDGKPVPPPAPPAPPAPSPQTSFRADESLTEAAPAAASQSASAGGGEPDPFGSQSPAVAEAPRGGLIEAAHCPSGHANPPRNAACYVCGLSMLEDQSLGLIEQPSVGRLVFVGGQSLSLNRAVVMGRKPDGVALGAHPVLIDHVEVSRSHAIVVIEGWTVLLSDQGSRNGTWVVPVSDPTPVRLDSGVPHVLEHGTVVHLGAPEVSFTYYFDGGE